MGILRKFKITTLVIENINACVQAFCQAYSPSGPVIEIGSYYIPEFEDISNRRKFFSDKSYIGCDLRKGLGVDRIEDAEQLSFPSNYAGTIMILETLEHLQNPAKAISEAQRVLRDDGLLMVSVPFAYRLHGFPADYWRFTSSGIYHLLSGLEQKIVFAIGPAIKPYTIVAIAAKNKSQNLEEATKNFQSIILTMLPKLRRRLFLCALQERARDLLGLILGRANISVAFYDPKTTHKSNLD